MVQRKRARRVRRAKRTSGRDPRARELDIEKLQYRDAAKILGISWNQLNDNKALFPDVFVSRPGRQTYVSRARLEAWRDQYPEIVQLLREGRTRTARQRMRDLP